MKEHYGTNARFLERFRRAVSRVGLRAMSHRPCQKRLTRSKAFDSKIRRPFRDALSLITPSAVQASG